MTIYTDCSSYGNWWVVGGGVRERDEEGGEDDLRVSLIKVRESCAVSSASLSCQFCTSSCLDTFNFQSNLQKEKMQPSEAQPSLPRYHFLRLYPKFLSVPASTIDNLS